MTAIGEGLLMGSDAFQTDAMSRSFAEKTIILMTDGNHNTGQSPAETVLTAKARGDTVHCITFGAGANQTLMADVAIAGGGIYLHAPDGASLIDAFRQIARTLPILLTE
jgi:Mg-chelatase subunit ChlD